MINNIASNGFDYICPATFACNFAVIGCALGVFLRPATRSSRALL